MVPLAVAGRPSTVPTVRQSLCVNRCPPALAAQVLCQVPGASAGIAGTSQFCHERRWRWAPKIGTLDAPAEVEAVCL